MSNTAITIFADNAGAVSFTNKKGDMFAISAEGALFKGGAALASLKDLVLRAAGDKAANGKYRAACDIIATAFPAHTKGFEKFVGTSWANKANFLAYLNSVELATMPKNGYSKKQLAALDFIRALRTIPGVERAATVAGEVVATA